MHKECNFIKWTSISIILVSNFFLISCSSNKNKTSKNIESDAVSQAINETMQTSAAKYQEQPLIIKTATVGAIFTAISQPIYVASNQPFRISRPLKKNNETSLLAKNDGIPYLLKRTGSPGNVGSIYRIAKAEVKEIPSTPAMAKNELVQNKVVTPVAESPIVTQVVQHETGNKCWVWPTRGNIVVPFAPFSGGNRGIDIAGQRGQPVYAAAAGTVVYAGKSLRSYGNLVLIRHDNDYVTAYAHNDRMLVDNGQRVNAGQEIATMGKTGTNSVRLYFQLSHQTKAVNPQQYLPIRGKKSAC